MPFNIAPQKREWLGQRSIAGRIRIFMELLLLALAAEPALGLRAIIRIIRGRRVAGWNLLLATASENKRCYRRWIELAEPCVIARYLSAASGDTLPSVACIILDAATAPEAAALTAASVRRAFDDNILVYTGMPDGAAETGRRWDHRWLLPLQAGDLVSPHLGRVLAAALERSSQPAILYWDEDSLIDGVRAWPWIKPDWEPLLFQARDGLSRACIIRADVSGSMDGTTTGLMAERMLHLACESGLASPMHIPLILSHLVGARDFASSRQRHMTPATNTAYIGAKPFDPQSWPSVSLIIPTRDHADMLDACLKGLRHLNYPGKIDLIIIDNDSSEADALALLEECDRNGVARVVRLSGPFNFSAFNNHAVHLAKGDFVCLMNNDVEAMDGEWLTAMMRHAMQTDVGAVGAQLLYPDGSIQHAGVAIGIGDAAGHIQKGVTPCSEQHHPWHAVTRQVSAVTAACMVVRRSHYLDVGGLDETLFPVAFNDVDLCLKLAQKGLRNVYVAEALLIHHESRSRGDDSAPDQAARFADELANLRAKWHTAGYMDPWYSPLFARTSERCLLAF